MIMTARLAKWFQQKWRRAPGAEVLKAYQVTFSTLHGQMVLQHLLDEVYCQTCPSTNPNDVLIHNARRTVIQEILENIDTAENPGKYETPTVEGAAHG